MNRTTDMTRGDPTGIILRFAFPLILTNIGQQLYSIVDAAIVGRGVGMEALAALGATDWLYWLVLWTIQAMTQGFSVLTAQLFGAGDRAGLKRAITMSVTLCAVTGVLMTGASVLGAPSLLRLLDTPENIMGGARLYLTAMYCGTPIVMAYNMAAAFLRALGDGKSPLVAMGVAGALNVALDILFVIVLPWGILGAALATLLSQLASFLYCAAVLRRLSVFSVSREDWRLDGAVLRRLCGLGLPLALQHFVIVIGGIIVQSVINSCGFVFVAGFTATNKLHGLLDCSATAFGHAVSTYMGQNWGARQVARMKLGLRRALLLALSLAAVISVSMILFGRQVVSLFLSASEQNAALALDIAYEYLFVMSVFLMSAYAMQVYRSALQGMGATTAPMLAGFVEFGARVGVALLLPRVLGEAGLYFTDGAAWFTSAVFLLVCYYRHMRTVERKIRER